MIKVLTMGTKLNVVDSDNNLVGFDLENDCCARGGYVISYTLHETGVDDVQGITDVDFPDYVFDTAFFKDLHNVDGEGGAVVFKMVPDFWAERKGPLPPLYLHLYNVHNGYYSKGFKASFDKVVIGSV